MLSRRTFLLGGGAAVVAGAAAVEGYGRERFLHKVGLVGSPDHRVPPSGWEVQERRLPDGTRWAFSSPPGRVRGVIVALHGRGNDRRFAFDTIHLHDIVASVGAPLAVASLDGGHDSYWHPRADGSDAAASVDAVLEHVTGTLFARPALLGWSMGGYGALLTAERHPDLFGTFGAVVASSPALWGTFAEAAPGAFDDARDFAEHDVFAGVDTLDPDRVRIDCGSHDPFAPAARRFVERLGPTANATFPNGWHDAAFWRSVAPAQVTFLASALR